MAAHDVRPCPTCRDRMDTHSPDGCTLCPCANPGTFLPTDPVTATGHTDTPRVDQALLALSAPDGVRSDPNPTESESTL